MDHKKYIPDLVIYGEDGKSVMFVEVKKTLGEERKLLEQLKTYMNDYYLNVGLVVSPEHTIVLKDSDSEEDEIVSTKIPTAQFLGESEVSQEAEVGATFEKRVYARVIRLVDEIQDGHSFEVSDLISRDLPFLLRNAKIRIGG